MIRQEMLPRYTVGFAGMAVSLLLVVHGTPSVPIAATGIYLLVICAFDTFTARIPNLCTLLLLLTGLACNMISQGLPGLWQTLLGFCVGLSLLLVPYLLGGIGGGDVKALAALGALLGPVEVFQVFLYIGLIGGLLAVLHFLFQKNLPRKIVEASQSLLVFAGTRDRRCLAPGTTETLRFPYAAAIAFGFFCYVHYGGIFSLLRVLLADGA